MQNTYAVAQFASFRENYRQNIERHMEFIRLASDNHAKIVIFPEMSLTGYERELAKAQCFTKDDTRLECLRKISADCSITVVAGGPLLLDNHLYIASWIFTPSQGTQIYTEKYLHPGEELYFEPGAQNDPTVILDGESFSFAICYDIERDEHVACVAEKKSDFYAASIFYTQNGIESGLARLQKIAKENSMAVLMSNCVGEGFELMAGGRSSIWSNRGELIISADSNSQCLVVAQNSDGVWSGRVIKQSR
jgi:predicted amidohydrolase